MVARDDVVIRWRPGSQPAGVDIVAYQVVVTREDPLRVMEVKLPALARTLTVPAQFLQPGVEYTYEVVAIDRSGNQTLTETSFTVE